MSVERTTNLFRLRERGFRDDALPLELDHPVVEILGPIRVGEWNK